MHISKLNAGAAAGAAIVTLLIAGSSHAEAAQSRPRLSAQIGVSSNYIDRGVSATNNRAQVFAVTELAGSAAYGGLKLTNRALSSGAPSDAESQAYLGLRKAFSGLTFDVGVMRHEFFGPDKVGDLGFTEAYAHLSRPIGDWRVTATAVKRPSGGGRPTYVELAVERPVFEGGTVSATLGQVRRADGSTEANWSLGVTGKLQEASLDLRWSDTDHQGLGANHQGRLVATLAVPLN